MVKILPRREENINKSKNNSLILVYKLGDDYVKSKFFF